jgi:hypothetical protein
VTKKLPKDQPLQIKIKNGLLSISIGIEQLAWAAECRPIEFKILDMKEFGKDVLEELTREEEDGTTLVNEMLDQAIQNAIDNGGLSFSEEKNPEWAKFYGND